MKKHTSKSAPKQGVGKPIKPSKPVKMGPKNKGY